MQRTVAFAVALVVAFVTGCGDNGDRDTSQEEAATTVTAEVPESAAGSADQTEGVPEPTSLFALPAEAILDSVEMPTAIGTNVALGLSMSDRDLFLAQFHPGSVVIDPIVPTLRPGMAAFYGAFGRAGTLCEDWPLDDVYVNLGGVLTSGSCEGFYRTLPDAAELPSGVLLVRHLPISDGLATGLMHRYEASFAATHPEESVVPIGFPASRSADVVAQTAVTEEFLDRLQSAWDTRDPAAIGALYANGATRHDGFTADQQGRQRIADWYALLFDAYRSVEITITEEYAGGLGPGALYALTMTTADGEACTMELAAVWRLDDEGLIEHEYVYYDANSVLTCGWTADSSDDEP